MIESKHGFRVRDPTEGVKKKGPTRDGASETVTGKTPQKLMWWQVGGEAGHHKWVFSCEAGSL